jgi:hypothetical protein
MLHVSVFYSLMIAPEDMIHCKDGCVLLSAVILVKFNFLGPLFLTLRMLGDGGQR